MKTQFTADRVNPEAEIRVTPVTSTKHYNS